MKGELVSGASLVGLLYVRSGADTWGWELSDGGIVEAGETVAETGAREVLEETGWRPAPLEFLLQYQPAARQRA